MPSSKRSPISYAPAFGGGIFRSKDEIAGDLAQLEEPKPAGTAAVLPAPEADAPPSNERTNESSRKRRSGSARSNEPSNGRSQAPEANGRTFEATDERSSVRTIADETTTPQSLAETDRTDERSNDRPTNDGRDDRRRRAPNERSIERTNEEAGDESEALSAHGRTNDRTTVGGAPAPSQSAGAGTSGEERARVRHSFDIYRDQLLSLGDIQLARHRRTGRKPKLGDLVQEALDAFVARERQPTGR